MRGWNQSASSRQLEGVERVSDEDDWRRAVAGDGDAFASIFDRHTGAVRRQAWRLSASRSDVEDVVAIVFLEAWRRRQAVRLVDGTVLPWLLVTTVYVCNNLRRSRLRHETLLQRLPAPSTAPDPADLIDEGDLLAALRRLKRSDQQVLTLCVLEEMTERDAAVVLAIPPGTVKSRLHRAKRRLSEQFRLSPESRSEVRHGL